MRGRDVCSRICEDKRQIFALPSHQEQKLGSPYRQPFLGVAGWLALSGLRMVVFCGLTWTCIATAMRAARACRWEVLDVLESRISRRRLFSSSDKTSFDCRRTDIGPWTGSGMWRGSLCRVELSFPNIELRRYLCLNAVRTPWIAISTSLQRMWPVPSSSRIFPISYRSPHGVISCSLGLAPSIGIST